jgi:hypothetical protein
MDGAEVVLGPLTGRFHRRTNETASGGKQGKSLELSCLPQALVGGYELCFSGHACRSKMKSIESAERQWRRLPIARYHRLVELLLHGPGLFHYLDAPGIYIRLHVRKCGLGSARLKKPGGFLAEPPAAAPGSRSRL